MKSRVAIACQGGGPYHIPMIDMSEGLANRLTHESKLDRSRENIDTLIIDGEKQGQKFIEARFKETG